MSLRLIGGKFKNHLIKTPTGLLTKPTMSMLRKSVFDICQGDVDGSKFLDVFACSGAMGLEALSRGASFATFIEKDRRATKCIQENLQAMHLDTQAKVLCGDALTLLKKLLLKDEIVQAMTAHTFAPIKAPELQTARLDLQELLKKKFSNKTAFFM